MLIFLSTEATDAERVRILDFLEQLGTKGFSTRFGGRCVFVVAEGKPFCSPSDPVFLEIADKDGVDEVVSVTAPYPLCSLSLRPEGSIIKAMDFSVGNGSFGVIGGPCSVESESQTLETARCVKAAGAKALRGGAFKPRTSPYAFQGLKKEGLRILAKVREETGLAIVTEAMSSEEALLVEEYADIVQIGTRNAQNYRLLETCGQLRKPVLLKRGFSCSLDEFLMSAEYILAGGNEQVILCERGIRTFESYVRYTLPINAIPVLKTLTHLPVVVDPSHSAGRADLVTPLALASAAAGADGLLVEVHPDPKKALCDGRQSLTPDEFELMLKACLRIRAALR